MQKRLHNAKKVVPLASPKIGYISEISKIFWYFARFALSLQPK